MSSAVTGTGSGSTTGNGSDGITATVAVVDETGEPGGKKKKTTKRRKVNHACLYCRRSHMTCDEGRPCQRCIKREIGHLCHDEQRPKSDKAQSQTQTQVQARSVSSTSNLATIALATSPSAPASTTLPYLMQPAQTQPSFYYGAEFGSEFSVLSATTMLYTRPYSRHYLLVFRVRPASPAMLVHHSITHTITFTHACISPHYTLRISSRRLPRTPPATFSKPSTTRPSFPHLLPIPLSTIDSFSFVDVCVLSGVRVLYPLRPHLYSAQ